MNTSKKNLKWILGRVQPNHRIKKIQKRSTDVSRKIPRTKKPELVYTPIQEIRKLQEEIEFLNDSLITVDIVFQGLHHAYQSSAGELERDRASTFLSDKEKELLTGYVELDLKANHLRNQLDKADKRIVLLKEEICLPNSMTSPCSSVETNLFEPDIPYSPCIYSDSLFSHL
ncbi:hypothetical protein BY458DRAFT_508502 [Sporodiniella umbellata]|nr:hypothetical protein BY458DRAFT_508502 [Sporodiniella umbellata]